MRASEVIGSQIRKAVIEGGNVLKIDELLAELPTDLDSVDVANVLAALVDGQVSDSEQYSILHAAESVDAQTYVWGVLLALPQLAQTSPRWTQTLVIRLMNSQLTTEVMLELVPHVADETRTALQRTVHQIEQLPEKRCIDQLSAIRAAIDGSAS